MKTSAMRAAATPSLTAQQAGSAQQPMSVSQANSLLAHALAVHLPAVFYVQGEISNFRTYDRGHAFFTMKDAGAELPCILWKDSLARLKFRPRDGMAVIARGNIKLYEPQGRVQLYVETMQPQGAGALELAFRQLCEKLKAEGLFEAARKRPLPRLPQHVVVVTSRTGDVLHDVLTTAWRRFPGLCVSLYPVRVQGDQAAGDMIRALQMLNKHGGAGRQIDLILLVRGGGSLEDLWAFNEEALARAIVASRIPIATGIGHEPDTTIADLVGDLRGPTPTGVTELTIPDVKALSNELQAGENLLTRDMRRLLTHAQTRLDRIAVALHAVATDAMHARRYKLDRLAVAVWGIEPRHAIAQGWRRMEESQRRLQTAARKCLVGQSEALERLGHRLERAAPQTRLPRLRDRVGHLEARLAVAWRGRLEQAKRAVELAEAQLRVVSPQAVLERGYSITVKKDGTIVRSPEEVRRGDVITTRVAKGEITSTVGKPKQESLF